MHPVEDEDAPSRSQTEGAVPGVATDFWIPIQNWRVNGDGG